MEHGVHERAAVQHHAVLVVVHRAALVQDRPGEATLPYRGVQPGTGISPEDDDKGSLRNRIRDDVGVVRVGLVILLKLPAP